MSLKVNISADGTKYVKELEKLRGQTAKFAGSVKGLLAGAFGITGITALVRNTIAFGSEMSDLATRTRTTVKEFMVFRDVARDAGVAQSVLERAMRNVVQRTQAAIDGNKSYAQSIERLGINMQEFGKLTTKDQLIQIANAFHNAGNQAEAFRDVAVILGERAGPQMTEVLRRIATEGYEKLAAAAVTMNDTTAASLDMAEDSIQKFKEQIIIFTGTTLIGFKQWGRGIKAVFEGVVIFVYSFISDMSEAASSFLDAWEKFFTGDAKGAKQAFDKMMHHYVDAGTRAADKVREHWDEAMNFEQPTLTQPGMSPGSEGFDPDERQKIEEEIAKLKQKTAEEEKKAQQIGISNAEKLKRITEERKRLEEELNRLKASATPGNVKEALEVEQKTYDLTKLITEEKQAAHTAMQDQIKAAQSLANIYEKIAELQGRPGGGAEVEAGEKAIIDRMRKEQELRRKEQAPSFPEKRESVGVELAAKQERKQELEFEMQGFVAVGPSSIKKLEAMHAESRKVQSEIEALQATMDDLALPEDGPEVALYKTGKAIEDVQGKLASAQTNIQSIADSISADMDAGIEIDDESFKAYKQAQEDIVQFEAELARLKETERNETLEYTAQMNALRSGLADAKKKEADALAALQVEPTDDPVKKMQAASGELIRLEKELDALRKKSLEDGEQSAEERQAIAEKEFELVQKIADARSETAQIRGEIAATRAAGEEAGMSDIEKLEAANKRQEVLEGQLEALQKAADADGRRTAEEELAIAQKRLEIEQGIADAKTIIAGAKGEIESRRRAREEEAMSPEELLARREQESAAAREALRKEKIKAAKDGTVTDAEGAIIETKKLDVEKALDAELAARKALEGQKTEGPGVVASSLAAIGGGGGVASFTQDPLLNENKRQTIILEAIRDGLRGAEQLEAAKGLKLPEL